MAVEHSAPAGPSLPDTYEPNLANTDRRKLDLQQAATMGNFADAATEYGQNLFGIPHVIANIADTFASSLIPGVGPDDFKNWLDKNGGEFGRFYNAHHAGIEAAGGLTGAFLPGMFAAKAVRSGGFIAKLAEGVLGKEAAGFVTSTGKSNTVLFEGLFQQARLRSESTVVTNLAHDASWLPAKGKAMARSVGDTLIEGAATEVAIAATMHSNDFLFPENWTVGDNIAMSDRKSVV